MTGFYHGYPWLEAAHHGGVRQVTQFLVVHTTENTQIGTAMDLVVAQYFHNQPANTGNPSSAHGVCDVDSLVRCVVDNEIAYHAGPHANTRALGLEHVGRASYSSAQWATAYTDGMLKVSAKQFADWCRRYNIPAVKISAADLRAGRKGICGHADVAYAWPGDTTHTDPGAHWPWAKFLALVQAELKPAPPTPKPPAPTKVSPEMFMYIRAAGPAAGHAVLVESGKQIALEGTGVHANLLSIEGVPYANKADAAQELLYDKAFGDVIHD